MLAAVGNWLLGWRWVTLRSGTRVKIDADGRIIAGGRAEWQGVHIGDVAEVSKRLRELESVDCAHECDTPAPRTFPSKEAGVAALLESNPQLAELLQREGGTSAEYEYRRWVRGGRRGKKPALGAGDGRFDALNERWELKGGRRVASWIEAVYVSVPTSRRWADFEARLPVLEEATGLRLELPAHGFRAKVAEMDRDECERRIDAQIGELLRDARDGRIGGAQPDDVPF